MASRLPIPINPPPLDPPSPKIGHTPLWDAVKAKQGAINRKDTALWQKNRPRNLFSYLIKCGECGGGCSMISTTQIGCSSTRNKGTCGNRLTISRAKLESAVLGALTDHLMDEELCAAFCEEYTQHLNRLRMDHNANLHTRQKELGRVERELDRLIDAICDGTPASRVKDRMIVLEDRRAELKELLASTKEAPVLFHPNMAQRYHQEVRQLIDSLNEEAHRHEAADLLRSLIERIVLTPTESRDRLTVDLV